jgi:hypothetical protein
VNATRFLAAALVLSTFASPAIAETTGTAALVKPAASRPAPDLDGFTIFSRETSPCDPVLATTRARSPRQAVPETEAPGTPTAPAGSPSPLTEPDTGLVVVAGLVAMLAATKKHRATSLVS